MEWKVVLPLLSALFAAASSGMPGGLSDANANDEGVRNALNFAVAQHNTRSNDMYRHDVMEVVKAQTQVVAGVKYVITVKMVKTGCRKNSANEQCTSQTSPSKTQPYQCTFTVWSRPWLNDIRLLDTAC
ncbi:cystatin C (amyloid angiopathy and cerebral hemorrhage) [Menidia menidia]